ncbi:hypothetical protein G6F47_009557 [Rhizopus delemar]|uniref:NADP-dependent oxidoreductase domain-containing protein n=2 Tax=Rhizopus TaxID=4842 RepID=A0A9P7C480_RHIOR|nr:hypothetical protein G6F51_011419 [Rhizopus arrhizus]KAG1578712.1 hypothetical protein G6F48_011716 [Rhizopus delemar]KAG1592033.1 hypothetical protein G6F47_009557 [Rhizopus delemar]
MGYAAAERLGDCRGYTCGYIGFTTGTNDAYTVVKEYIRRKPKASIKKYIPALKKLTTYDFGDPKRDDTTQLKGFDKAWHKTTCDDPVFIQTQLDVGQSMYLKPALKYAASVGIHSNLGKAIFYDTIVQHGWQYVESFINLPRIIELTGPKKKEESEKSYLTRFITTRRQLVCCYPGGVWNDSADRMQDLQYLINQWSQNKDLINPVELKIYGVKITGKENILVDSQRCGQISPEQASDIVKTALELGINHFDVAESHSGGQAEIDLGLALRNQLGLRRSDYVISTKVFWGGKGPNDRGLSRKHVFEGTVACLQRLQLDYVDILYAQRPDPDTPMEEIVRAFNWCIDKGMALYWGTSEWPAYLITEAMHVANRLNLIAPITESPQYNMLNRERVEKEYLPMFQKYKLGTCIWSPLASGLLSGKYNDGIIPPYTRLAIQDHPVINRLRAGFFSEEGRRKLEKIKMVCSIAQRLGCTPAQLGASTPLQARENIQALSKRHLLTDDVMHELDRILGNVPESVFDFRKS